jgi:hypothetical protein
LAGMHGKNIPAGSAPAGLILEIFLLINGRESTIGSERGFDAEDSREEDLKAQPYPLSLSC